MSRKSGAPSRRCIRSAVRREAHCTAMVRRRRQLGIERRGRCCGHAVGEHDRILDRLVRSLALVGHHRVRGVAHQHDAIGVPALERRQVVQRPARPDVGGADHLGHGRVPAGEGVDGVGDRAFLHPRVVRPLRDAHDRQEVHDPAAVDRVVQEMTAGPGPELQRRRVGQRRHLLDGHQPPVADGARVPSRAPRRRRAGGSPSARRPRRRRHPPARSRRSRTAARRRSRAPRSRRTGDPGAGLRRPAARRGLAAAPPGARRSRARRRWPRRRRRARSDDRRSPRRCARHGSRARSEPPRRPRPARRARAAAARACRWPTARPRRRSRATRPPARTRRRRRRARAARARTPARRSRRRRPRRSSLRRRPACGRGRARSRR